MVLIKIEAMNEINTYQIDFNSGDFVVGGDRDTLDFIQIWHAKIR